MRIALTTLLVALAPLSAAHAAGTIRIATPPDVAAQVEVLGWTEGERARVVAAVLAPGEAALPAGSYGLRVQGTDHRLGPVRVREGEATRLELGALRIVAPAEAAPTTFFALTAGGAAAGRARSDGRPQALWPGSYRLVRDLGEVERALEVSGGVVREVACGALALAAPGELIDAPYHVISDEQPARTVAYASTRGGAQALLPGRYRVVRARSGVISQPFVVEAGRSTRLACAALRVVPLDAGRVEYAVYGQRDERPLLRARSGAQGHLVFPGEYFVAPWTGRDVERGAALAIRLRAGGVTTLWVDGAGRLAPDGGDVPVEVAAHPGGLVIAGRPLGVRVRLAERVALRLRLRALGDGAAAGAILTELGAWPVVNPPRHDVEPLVPGELADDVWVRVEAEATLAAGAPPLVGRSRPLRLVHPRAGLVRGLTASARGPTVVALRWTPPPGPPPAGYRVYRTGAPRPIHGDRLLREPSFVDLGRSAGRVYAYEVCAVDPRGVEGPRAPASAHTAAAP